MPVFAGERLLACFSPQPRLWTGAIAGDWVTPRNTATEWMTPPASSVLSTRCYGCWTRIHDRCSVKMDPRGADSGGQTTHRAQDCHAQLLASAVRQVAGGAQLLVGVFRVDVQAGMQFQGLREGGSRCLLHRRQRLQRPCTQKLLSVPHLVRRGFRAT